MFLLGINLPLHKHVYYAIQKYEGIGPKIARIICDKASIHKFCKIKDLNDQHLAKLKPLIQSSLENERQKKLLELKMRKASTSSS